MDGPTTNTFGGSLLVLMCRFPLGTSGDSQATAEVHTGSDATATVASVPSAPTGGTGVVQPERELGTCPPRDSVFPFIFAAYPVMLSIQERETTSLLKKKIGHQNEA